MKSKTFLFAVVVLMFVALAPSQSWAQVTDTAATEQPAPEWPASEGQISYETLHAALSDASTNVAALEGAEISEVHVVKVEDAVSSFDESQQTEINSLADAATPLNDNEVLSNVLAEKAATVEENADIIGVALEEGTLYVVTRAGM